MLARMLGTHAMSRTSTAMKVEAAAILTGAGLVTIAAFTQAHFPLTFLPCIAVVAAAYRLGPFGAAAGMLIVTIITSLMTGQGYGPISARSEEHTSELQSLMRSSYAVFCLKKKKKKKRNHLIQQHT